MKDEILNTLYRELLDILPARDPLRGELAIAHPLPLEDKVVRLWSILERLFRFLGEDIAPDPNTSIAKVVSSLTKCHRIPENVADAARLVRERRNKLPMIHPVGRDHERRAALKPREFSSVILCVTEILEWAVSRDFWNRFVSRRLRKRVDKSEKATIPQDDWFDCRIRPAVDEDIPQIIELDAASFEDDDLISEEQQRAWRNHDDRNLTCATVKGDVAGYYAVLWMEPEILAQFLAGSLRESDLTSDTLCPAERAMEQDSIYVSAVVIRQMYSHVTMLLLRHLIQQIQQWRKSGNLRFLYAIAATPEGENLIQERFGFTRICDGSARLDRHPVFKLDLENWTRPDWAL